MISEIKAGERFYQPVVLRLQKVGTSSNGGVFAKGTVEDNSGKVQFIAFEKDIVNRLRNLEGPKAYVIAGPVDIVKYSSNLALQVIIQKLDPIMPEDDISNLVPVGDFDITQYQAKLAGLIEGIRTPSLRMLLQKIFSGKFYEDFCKNPAGTKMHHAYLGGLLQHSVDVASLASLMAGEIGGADKDIVVAGALLHDIGKAVDHEVEGPHAQIGADLAKKYRENNQVIHAIQAHHGDVEPSTVEAVLVQAADAISAARPGARRETLENYIKRLEKLEEIANSFEGVDKSFAIQAGREIRILVKPENVNDADTIIMAKEIVKRIETELEYPGQIKVNVIRETRAVEFAK